MANYVKFIRGTNEAYLRLLASGTKPEDDALYFISDADSDDVTLYLGSKLVAGGSSECPSFNIGKDIKDQQILVYDINQSAWVNANVIDIISNFVGATDESAGKAGLVPAPELQQTNLFLRSDGKWAAIEGINTSTQLILTITNNNNTPHQDLIIDEIAGLTVNQGDIIIIKDLIFDDKYQYTAYVYDGNEWVVMAGDYNANNIYFSEDLTNTIAAGHNLTQVLNNIIDQVELSEDNSSISINNNVLSLKNYGIKYYKYVAASGSEENGDFIAAHYELCEVDENNPWISGLEPRVALENGQLVLGWYEQNPTTIDGINASLATLQTDLNDLSNSVNGIIEEIGTPANEGLGTEATGLYAEIKSEVAQAIANVDHLTRKIVASYEEIEEYISINDDGNKYIFMVPLGVTDYDNKYDEFIVIDGIIEPVGNWSVDLEDYVKKEDLPFTAVDSTQFIINENTLTLNSVPMEAVNGLNALNNKVTILETSVGTLSTNLSNLQGLVSNNSNSISELQQALNSYVTLDNFEKTVGNLNDLLAANSSLSAQVNEIKTQLTWQDLQ